MARIVRTGTGRDCSSIKGEATDGLTSSPPWASPSPSPRSRRRGPTSCASSSTAASPAWATSATARVSQATGERPVDELARRLFDHGGVEGVHIYSNMVTVDLAGRRRPTGCGR